MAAEASAMGPTVIVDTAGIGAEDKIKFPPIQEKVLDAAPFTVNFRGKHKSGK